MAKSPSNEKSRNQSSTGETGNSNNSTKKQSPQEDNMDLEEETIFPLTDECHHYQQRKEVPWDIQKYWDQRYSIWTAYDDGIHMTDDAWFGVTPEPVANKVASDLTTRTPPSKTTIIDIFAGAGGNAIAFALSGRWTTVIAIEKNPSVIACAQHNAYIYGVSSQITWINADCFDYLSSQDSSIDLSKTVIFASPPWGGPGYRSDKVFNLKTMLPYSVQAIHDACKMMDSALYLPRTSDLRQIAKLAPPGEKVEVVQYCMEGASKALVAYIPAASSQEIDK
ncbi:RNA methylase family protein-like protein [Venustampulla echinocandica]|uniref:Trimethylguanosine synthase n=1 Tax=Venustampulla echinocandica TaxID=2656787 RepID=A0A370THS8_9HELO|nr:RNA methylase family protein-like protein [Venustampulla echinocandica]RDL34751.1 RNA methylase family protein-like protein [Venustampulla echinocandica]